MALEPPAKPTARITITNISAAKVTTASIALRRGQMTDRIKIKYWWSDDRKWFCILLDDGINKSTVSLTPEESGLLSMNAVLDGDAAPSRS
jgi:hypothetical protein